MSRSSSQNGFSLVEAVVAMGVLTVGVLGAAAVLATGMRHLSGSPADVVMAQKAAQAIEAVFSARDSGKVTWAQIRNVSGVSGGDGGIFLDGPQSLLNAGPDGLVNTGDDETAATATTDDPTTGLSQYKREIAIRDVVEQDGRPNGQVRSVTVTLTYGSGPTKKTYTLQTLISTYS